MDAEYHTTRKLAYRTQMVHQTDGAGTPRSVASQRPNEEHPIAETRLKTVC